jgi:hypothetical protein
MRGSRLLVRTPSHEPAEGECSESEAGYTGAGGGVRDSLWLTRSSCSISETSRNFSKLDRAGPANGGI